MSVDAGFASTQAPSDTAPTSTGPQYTSTQYSHAFPARGLYVEGPPTLSPIPAGSQITFSKALQLVSTPVGAGASLVSEDTEVDNILATTPGVDDDMAIPDTAVAVADYELPSTTEVPPPPTPTTTTTASQSPPSTCGLQGPVPARVFLAYPAGAGPGRIPKSYNLVLLTTGL